jgi:hypothetical protein
VEKIIGPNINVVKREVLIRFLAKLGSGLSGISVIMNLSQSLTLPTAIIGIVGIPQMMFTNPIMTIHVNMTAN